MTGECPYIGLQPFKEEDYPYFFGREREVRVIASNLRTQRLTVLYGPSGVGKSSLLRAGVLRHLRSTSDDAVVYYSTWQRESFLTDLTEQCQATVGINEPGVEFGGHAGHRQGQRLLLLLDQFEELLLYHDREPVAEQFDALLARLVNIGDLPVNVLIGIREDSLSRFDQRYSIRIADLLGNTLPLEHLSLDAGRRAILGPLEAFNERFATIHKGWGAEPELVDDVLRQVQVRRFAEAYSESALHTEPIGGSASHVETPFLQMVLKRLWNEEIASGSNLLRLDTLGRIGGANRIVEQHVATVLAGLASDDDRAIAAGMFRYLVTPSRSKISQATADLIDYAEAPAGAVRNVLDWLSNRPESRILRRLDTPERYEIFHDVLAQPILDWRRKFYAQKDALEREREQKDEAERSQREVQRLRWMAVSMAVLALLALSFAWYGLIQRRRVSDAADDIKIEAERRLEAESIAQAARDRERAAEAEVQAKIAESAGLKGLATQLRESAETAMLQALESDRRAGEAGARMTAEAGSHREAQVRNAMLERERDQLLSQLSSLTTELEQLRNQRSQLVELQRERTDLLERVASLTAEIERLRKGVGASLGVGTPLTVFRDCAECPEMVVIPEGTFTMGSPTTETSHDPREGPIHSVKVTAFALGQYEVTRGEFEVFASEMGLKREPCLVSKGTSLVEDAQRNWRAPGFRQTPRDPVVCVSWRDAVTYVQWLATKTKHAYRLPSEAEWEYAARANTTTRWFWGEDPSQTCEYANVGCGNKGTIPVGTLKPNRYGLYDMLGNVWEWAEDCWNEGYSGAPVDGTAWSVGSCQTRVIRGSSYELLPDHARSAIRIGFPSSDRTQSIGFRVAMTLP